MLDARNHLFATLLLLTAITCAGCTTDFSELPDPERTRLCEGLMETGFVPELAVLSPAVRDGLRAKLIPSMGGIGDPGLNLTFRATIDEQGKISDIDDFGSDMPHATADRGDLEERLQRALLGQRLFPEVASPFKVGLHMRIDSGSSSVFLWDDDGAICRTKRTADGRSRE